MKKIKSPPPSAIVWILKKLKIKMDAYIWGLYPSENLLNKSEPKHWNEYISKKPNEKITYNNLEKRFFDVMESKRKTSLSKLEKEYGKKIDKIPLNILQQNIEYLKDVFKFEKERQDRIDNKFMQIINQSSILIAFLTLLLTLVSDKINFNLNNLILLIFLGINILYVIRNLAISIFMAVKNLSPVGYKKPQYPTVLFNSDNSNNNFVIYKFVNLYESLEKNVEVNNSKADKVEIVYKKFRSSLIALLIFCILTSFYITIFPKKADYSIDLVNQLDLTNIQNELKNINESFNSTVDIYQISSITSQITNLNNKLHIIENDISKEKVNEIKEIKNEIIILENKLLNIIKKRK